MVFEIAFIQICFYLDSCSVTSCGGDDIDAAPDPNSFLQDSGLDCIAISCTPKVRQRLL